MKHTLTRTLAGISILASALFIPALPANAATAHRYTSCAQVHQAYSGGIAKAGIKYNTIKHRNGTVTKEKLKGNVKHSTALYNANRGLDRDHDGIACEKS